MADGGLVDEPVTSDAARNRAESPWHFQLNKQAINRLRPPDSGNGSGSGLGSGNVTPPSTRFGASTRALSGPRTASVVQAAQRASYESALLAAVRRQIEGFEEKVGGQINRIQSQSERAREATLTRLEEKMTAADSLQPKLDRRLAELSGNFKGLSDEMQSQIRRVDLMDDRLWEWRHQMEEELRHKYSDFEQNLQKVTSGFKVMTSSLEDAERKREQKLHRLEADLSERGSCQEDISQAFANICVRLDALEEAARVEDEAGNQLLAVPSFVEVASKEALASSTGGDAVNSLYDVLAKHVEDLSAKVDRALQDNHDLHASTATQEEQLKTLRTLFETREEQKRGLVERVERGDWESKVEQLRQAVQEDGKLRLAQAEQLEILSKRLEHQEQTQDAIVTSHNQLLRYGSQVEACDDSGVAVADIVEACQSKLSVSQEQLQKLSEEVQELRADSLGQQVSDLVQQLKDVVPMVIAHEQSIKHLSSGTGDERLLQLREEVGQLRLDMTSSQGAVDDRLKAQVQATTEELQQLQSRCNRCEEVVAEHRELWDASAEKLRGQLQQLSDKVKSQSENSLSETFAGTVEELQRKLEAVSQAVVQAAQPSEEIRVSQRAQEERFAGITAELQQKLAAVSQAVLQAAQAQGAESDLRAEMGRLEGSFQSSLEQQSEDFQQKLSGSMQDLRHKLQSMSDMVKDAAAPDDGLRSELDELRTGFQKLSEESQQRSSGPVDLPERLQQLSQVALQAAEAQNAADDSKAILRQEMSELRSRSEASAVQLREVLDSNVFDVKLVAEAWKGPLRDLQDDLEAMKAMAAAPEVSDTALRDLQTVVESFKDQLQGTKASTDQEGLQALRSEVAELSSRLDALVTTISKGGLAEGDLRREVTELAMIMKQDEEAEAGAHKRILGRIDELCVNLSQVTESGVPTDFAQKFEGLVRQVEEMQKVEHEIEVKIDEVASKLG